MQHAEIKMIVPRLMPHAADERHHERVIISSLAEHFIDCRVVYQGRSIAVLENSRAFPLHDHIESQRDQVDDAVIAEFAFRLASER